jgi:DNA-binding CsgD family transcriptional regulator
MLEADENLEQLVQGFTLYCVQLRRCVPLNGGKHDPSPPLKELLEKLSVTEGIDHKLASPIYVEKVISCTVADDKVMAMIWEEHFCRQVTITDVAERANYSPRSIARLVKLFPKKVAHQLWMKNHELTNPQKTAVSVKTIWQQHHEIISSQKLGLTDTEIKVVLAFMRLENQSRKEIARELSITTNTLKTHRRSILKKMKVSTIREAVDKVRVALWKDETDDKQN